MDMEEIIALVEKAKNGDQSAIAQLYEATSKAVYFTALKIVGNPSDAEDIAQDTYVTAISKLSDLKDNATFPKWIKTIAANTAKNYMTKKKPMLFNTDEDEEATLGSIPEVSDEFIPDQAADKKETCRLVSEMIDNLPEKQRAALVMFYYDEMTISEIAEAMGTNDNTIKSRLNYARKYIKDEVEALAKKGTKLYGVAGIPLIAFVLRNLAADTAVPTGIAAKVTAATAATTTAAATATTATATATATATTAAASTAATGVALGTAAKVAIAAVASVAVIGGGVAISNLFSEEAEPVIAETTISETTPVTTAITTTITTTTAVTTTVPITTEITTTAVTLPEAEFGVASEIELMLENYLFGDGELDTEYFEAIEELEICGKYVAVNRDINERFGYEDTIYYIGGDEWGFMTKEDYNEVASYPYGDLENIDFVSDMKNLKVLKIKCNSVYNIEPVKGLEKLNELDLYVNKVKDLSAVSNLKNLETLSLGNNEISDISPLEELKGLKNLYLSCSNKISDLSPLNNLNNLEKLSVGCGSTLDISYLKGLKKLTYLDLHECKIDDIDVLTNLKKLESLTVKGSGISKADVEELRAALPECEIIADDYDYEYEDVIAEVEPVVTTTAATTTTTPVTTEITTPAVTLPEAEFGVASEIELMLESYLFGDGELDTEYFEAIEELYIYGEYVAVNRDIYHRFGVDKNKFKVYLDSMSSWFFVSNNIYEEANEIRYHYYENLDFLYSSNYMYTENSEPESNEKNGEGSMHYISFIEDMPNLSTLEIVLNSIYDISPICNLKKLENLKLSSAFINDISSIERLSGLKKLNLYNNMISDISALKNLINIEELYLGGNDYLSDISPIAELSKLKKLDLCSNSYSCPSNPRFDISVLSKLTYLEYLNLDGNSITDISSLSSLHNLKALYLRENSLTDISAIRNLTELEYLDLSGYHAITNYEPFENLKKIKFLDLDMFALQDNLGVTDISPLGNLTEIEYLNISGWQELHDDISALNNLTKLEYLDISGFRRITNYSPLKNLFRLKHLDISCHYSSPDFDLKDFLTECEIIY